MTSLEIANFKLECLKVAVEMAKINDSLDIQKLAKELFDWVCQY